MVGGAGSILEIQGGILIHQVWFAFIYFILIRKETFVS